MNEKFSAVEHNCVESQLPGYQVADDLPRKQSEEDEDLIAAYSNAGLKYDGTTL